MHPNIEVLSDKKLIGKRIVMSLSKDRTGELWKGFMPRRKEIRNNLTNELISMRVYDKSYDFNNIDLNTTFEKWAAIEVSDFTFVPEEMEPFLLPGGLYAVFLYKGASSEGRKIFQFIFGSWLHDSDYLIDSRPHFEILGNKYKNDDPDSEEEIWIPIKQKTIL